MGKRTPDKGKCLPAWEQHWGFSLVLVWSKRKSRLLAAPPSPTPTSDAQAGPLVTEVEGDAHETVKKLKDPIDLLFLDADPKGYLDYLDKIGHLVRPGGLIVTHNVSRPAPDPAWIKCITASPELITDFLNMHAAGIAVSLKRK